MLFLTLLLSLSSVSPAHADPSACDGRCVDTTGKPDNICHYQPFEGSCRVVPGCQWMPGRPVQIPGSCVDTTGNPGNICRYQPFEGSCHVVPGCAWVPGQLICQ